MTVIGYRQALKVVYLTCLLSFLLVGCNKAPSPSVEEGTEQRRETSSTSLPNTAPTFEEAKRWLYQRVYFDHRKTFYCSCDYAKEAGRAGEIDLASCGVVSRRDRERSRRLEVEHVFPAAQFGNFRPCWRDVPSVCGKQMSGRKCCEQVDPVFRAAHNDLHNLYPAEGEINGDRRDYNWGMIPGNRGEYGVCSIQIDSSIRRVEPPDAIKGDIARTMFYMEDTYHFRLSNQDRQLFTAWSRTDPPDAWEIERDRRIAAIQGKGNRFIEDYSAIFGKAGSVSTPATPDSKVVTPPASTTGQSFTCGMKTRCSQMQSCEEAKFYLEQCGVTSLDGNHDGRPCEKLCR